MFAEIARARPKLHGLADAVLTYSRVSQVVERLFSHLQLTGSKLRNKLECVAVERELRLIKESPPWQTANFEEAMKVYFALRRRGYGMRKTMKRTLQARQKGAMVLTDPDHLLWLLKGELEDADQEDDDISVQSDKNDEDEESADEREGDEDESSSDSSASLSDSDSES